jgi:hypothetical protein
MMTTVNVPSGTPVGAVVAALIAVAAVVALLSAHPVSIRLPLCRNADDRESHKNASHDDEQTKLLCVEHISPLLG